ncbi:hypothetical protein Ae201684P_000456 [Aphanomyces euteiches]|uniref:Enoyl reductase (ER) domain-containing protein n=1 Tax=Aphanomyces euteiches TaxID=100861 RepID=A0A6G0XAQ9_9STRA|nr:hypothetical protein Ae201684_006822 [Aphanomyces euteiches]KAH9087042.1 hypothetical protein Ae201684P_000456 [Aphanomyces euteiches]
MASIPSRMRALMQVKRIAKLDRAELATCFELQTVDVPVPKAGQVLVKVESAAVHPSNLSALQGLFATGAPPLPAFTGTEGSGTVVATGSGWWPWWLSGKRVATMVPSGMWAEYVVAEAQKCVVLPDDVSFEAGTSCFVNPLTSMSFVQIAQANNAKTIVHTAAASALGTSVVAGIVIFMDSVGKMLVRYAAQFNIQVIGVVRSQEQVEALHGIGAKYVVNTSTEGWQDELTNLCNELNASIGFDCVGGELPGQVQACMPAKSELFVYGNLTGQPWANFSPGDIRFNNKKITGFFLFNYLSQQGSLGMFTMLGNVTKGIKTTFATSFNAAYPLEDAVDAIAGYATRMTNNKIVFKPQEKKATALRSSL